MTITARVVVRAWRLDRALAIAVAEAVVARTWWHTSTHLPTVERAVPMAAVVPPLLTISLSWAMLEQWSQQMATTTRSPVVLRAGRFAALLAIGVAAAFTAAARADGMVIATTAVGVALAGLVEPTLRRWTWMPLVLAGYAWLQYAARHPVGDIMLPGFAPAVLAGVVGGAAYAFDLGGRQRL
jgi:hypothetical protein